MLRCRYRLAKHLGSGRERGVSTQEEFDKRYVTSAEICVDLSVSRVSVFNRRKAGELPDPIVVRTPGRIHMLLWERDKIAPHLERWRQQLAERRA
jgi:hypothetical protein